MPLTDMAIRAAKPADKNYKLFDGLGLYLEVATCGGKWWRFKYHFEDKEKRLSLGVYPKVGLNDAWTKRDEARELLDTGIDPGMQRKASKQVLCDDGDPASLEAVAREWFAKSSPNWAESHAVRIIRRLERDVFPWIGSKNSAQIGPAMVPRSTKNIAHSTPTRAGKRFALLESQSSGPGGVRSGSAAARRVYGIGRSAGASGASVPSDGKAGTLISFIRSG